MKIKKKFQKINKHYILLFLISIFIFLPFISKTYYYGHDSAYHIINVLAITKSWTFTNTLTLKVLPFIANNLGYGSPIFYPQLPHFLIAFVYKIIQPILNVTYAIKIVLFLEVFISSILMYKLIEKISKNKNASLIGATFYITSAYTISEIYARSAINELFVFLFLPLVFLGIIYLTEKDYRKFYINFVIGYVGLINCHLVISVYITIFIIITLLFNLKTFLKKEIILRFMLASVVILLLCSPFLVPMLEHKTLGNYAVFEENIMTTNEKIQKFRLDFFDLFNLKAREDNIYFTLNMIAVMLFGLFCYKNKKIQNKNNSWLVKCIIFGVFSLIIIMSFLFPWKYMPGFLKFIQFPWRLNLIVIFLLSIGASLSIELFDKKIQKGIVCVCIVSSVLYANYFLSNYKPIFVDDESYQYSTDLGVGGKNEYYPSKSLKKLKEVMSRNNDIVIKKGTAKITVVKNDTPYLKFKIKDVKDSVTLELPRVYYLGYEIIEKDKNGKTKKLKYYENSYGLMEIKVNKNSTITVKYTATLLNRIANYIFCITLLFCIFYLIKSKKFKFKKN